MFSHAAPAPHLFNPVEDLPGIHDAMLREDDATGGFEALIRFEPGAVIPAHTHTHADEAIFVVDGDFIVDGETHAQGAYFYAPAGMVHGPVTTAHGCTLFVRFTAEFDFVPTTTDEDR